ncbi:hypothetical protein AB0J38_35715 [Streptomyces sp. NPDC050095]
MRHVVHEISAHRATALALVLFLGCVAFIAFCAVQYARAAGGI